MRKIFYSFIVLFLLSLHSLVLADGWRGHIEIGQAFSHLSNGDSSVWMNQSMQNQYSGASADDHVLVGIGSHYAWTINHFVVELGGSAYYLHTHLVGLNTPFTNGLGNAPTLDYRVSDHSYAVFFEPKISCTSYIIQPYVLAGIGVASNQLSDYSETPHVSGSGAAPTGTPFVNQNNTNLAWEAGVGIQYPTTISSQRVLFSVDYRYMNWGKASLGQAIGTSSGELDFGKLSSNTINVKVVWELD